MDLVDVARNGDRHHELDEIIVGSSGVKRLSGRQVIGLGARLARLVAGDVAYQFRSRINIPRGAVQGAPEVPGGLLSASKPPCAAPQYDPLVTAEARLAQEQDQGKREPRSAQPSGTKSLRTRVTSVYASYATRLMHGATATPNGRLIAAPSSSTTTLGVDNFGAPVNSRGGVSVRPYNLRRNRTLLIQGEYDSLVVSDGRTDLTIARPYSYGELFDRVSRAEIEFGLFDVTSADGVHVWEIGRSALILSIARALGMFATDAFSASVPNRNIYDGQKSLYTLPPARRVIFPITRRGGLDHRTSNLADDDSIFIVPPDPDGYPGVTETNALFPQYEYWRWRSSAVWLREVSRLPRVDPTPFEQALESALEIPVRLGDFLTTQLPKFHAERTFFGPILDRVGPQEVLITQSQSRPGLCHAAREAGALVIDIQYALTSRYHPSFWYPTRPRYAAERIYAWSDFWAARTNAFAEHAVSPRGMDDWDAFRGAGSEGPVWDVCVIAQPPVFRHMASFVKDVLDRYPEWRVIIAPHPSQRVHGGVASPQYKTMIHQLALAGILDRVTVGRANETPKSIMQSRICLGVSSTSLYEAAAARRPTFIIPAPGYEYAVDDIASGLFRMADSPDSLVEYEVPSWSENIFAR